MRSIGVLLALVAAVTVCACGGSTDGTRVEPPDSSTESTDAGIDAAAQDTAAPAEDLAGADLAGADLTGVPQVVRFIAVGDTGRGDSGQASVATAMKNKCMQSGCDFVQLLGDNIYDSGVTSTSDAQWQTKFETPYAMINVPFWAVLGNHDYGGNGDGDEYGKGAFEVAYTQVSSKWKLPSAYWHRTDKHVEFFGLDTNMARHDMSAQQKVDVHSWVTASTATWKIALGHHPYFSNGPHGNEDPGTLKTLYDDEICGKVDLLLTGHDHSRQWLTAKCGGTTEVVVSGAGASATTLPGSNSYRYQSTQLGFLYIVIDGNTLTGEFINVAGNVDFTRTLTK